MTNELKQKDTRQKESTERREKKGYSVRKNNRVNQNKKEIEGEKVPLNKIRCWQTTLFSAIICLVFYILYVYRY